MSTTTLNAASDAAVSSITRNSFPTQSKYDVSSRRVELWSPWSGHRHPSTAAGELAFMTRLRELAVTGPRREPGANSHSRRDVTALVTSLRGGMSADEMLEMAPGLRPASLVAAYGDLEARRLTSAQAWRALGITPVVCWVGSG